jgi:hypothetical protein
MLTKIKLSHKDRPSDVEGQWEKSVLTLKVVGDKNDINKISTAIKEAINKCSNTDEPYGWVNTE